MNYTSLMAGLFLKSPRGFAIALPNDVCVTGVFFSSGKVPI